MNNLGGPLEALNPAPDPAPELAEAACHVPLPSVPVQTASTAILSPVSADDRAISKLLEVTLNKAGMTVAQVSKELGVSDNAVRQYIRGYRANPSLKWFLRFAEICGATVQISFKDNNNR